MQTVCVKQRPPVCLNCFSCVTQQGYLLVYAQDKACMCPPENKPQMLSATLPSGKEAEKSLWLGQVAKHLIKARQRKGRKNNSDSGCQEFRFIAQASGKAELSWQLDVWESPHFTEVQKPRERLG